jgi:hypothetical protein
MVFPVYDVFAFLGDRSGAELVEVRCTPAGSVDAMALGVDGRRRVMVANLAPTSQRVSVEGLGTARARVALLDEHTVAAALSDSRLAAAATMQTQNGSLALDLLPYAVAFVSEEHG